MPVKELARYGAATSKKPLRKNKFFILWQLFWLTFRISAVTIGGGYAIVAVLKRELVDKRGWLKEHEMLDYTAISQSTIGPTAVNASLLVGQKLAGVWGAAAAVVGSVLPPMIVMTAIAYFYKLAAESALVKSALVGMQAATAAVIADAAISLGASVWRIGRVFAISIAAIVFALAAFTGLSTSILILGAGAVGLLRSVKGSGKVK